MRPVDDQLATAADWPLALSRACASPPSATRPRPRVARQHAPHHGGKRRPVSTLIKSGLALATALTLAATFPQGAQARNWTLQQETAGNSFYDDYWWWPYGDPTHGTVSYQSEANAIAQNLSYVDKTTGRFVMRMDSDNFVSPSSEGRASVRIHSKETMRDGLLIIKISHMPIGCGTWPAVWTATTQTWPIGGEIDIIEGVSATSTSSTSNLASLHTTDGCGIPEGRYQNSTGYSYQQNCAYQPGCSQRFSQDNTFGAGFNKAGGGYFAMLRDTASGGNGISVYFWPDSTPKSQIPSAVRAPPGAAPRRVITSPYDLAPGGDNNTVNKLPDKTYDWGIPAAFFPNTAPGATFEGAQCEMDRYYDADHTIIINLSACGDWAGQVWSQSPGCAALAPTCDEYVRNNPHAFEDARFEIDYIRVYGSQNSQGAGSVILGKGRRSRRPGPVTLVGSVLAVSLLAGLWAF
ncbi:hypothetical protein OC844_000478 [Tilletia horrida]|nr:hypothetical protein OC844_000478 [Tilletia horrida]